MKRLRATALISGLLFTLVTCASARENKDAEWRKRDRWQDVPSILRAMGVDTDSRVADVGCNDGYLTVHLARAVGTDGRVYAVDVSERALERLDENLARYDLTNVTPIHSEPDDPRLPGDLDAVVIVHAYHEMDEHDAMLRHIRTALRPGGRLVIIDAISPHRRGESRPIQTAVHELELDYVREDLQAAGFQVMANRDPFVEHPDDGETWWMLIARRPAGDDARSRRAGLR